MMIPQFTDEMGYAAIERAKKMPKSVAITRFFGVAMVYYRHPVGDAAWAAMVELTDQETVDALALITGIMAGATVSHNDPWPETAGIVDP